MTDKEQIIIDGVNVLECEHYEYKSLKDCEMRYPESGDCGIGLLNYLFDGNLDIEKYCKDNSDCYFKQLARKTQECEQKDKELLSNEKIINKLMKEVDELRQECEELKDARFNLNCEIYSLNRYRKALEEIELTIKNLEKDDIIKYEGELQLGDFSIPCYVLDDGTRVLSGRGMQESLKMVDEVEDGKQKSGTRLQRYLGQKTLEPFIYKNKGQDHFKPVICYKGSQKINGYEATVLANICDAFLEARKHITLSPRQKIILIRGFAKVGIIALVDEATGYQHDREND